MPPLIVSILILFAACSAAFAENTDLKELTEQYEDIILDCDNLVVLDVKKDPESKTNTGSEIRIVSFDVEKCRHSLPYSISLASLLRSAFTQSIPGIMIKAFEENSENQSLDSGQSGESGITPPAGSRRSKYWEIVKPFVSFCQSLGTPDASHYRKCTFGAVSEDSSHLARQLFMQTSSGRAYSSACEPDPVGKMSSSPVFQPLFEDDETVLSFSTIQNRLRRDGFTCHSSEYGTECSKRSLEIVTNQTDMLAFLAGMVEEPGNMPDPNVLLSIANTAISLRDENAAAISGHPNGIVMKPAVQGADVARNGVCLDEIYTGPMCGLPHLAIMMLINDFSPEN